MTRKQRATTDIFPHATFPQYEGKPLSWSIGLYFTYGEEAKGYPRMRAVIRAMIEHRPEQIEHERREMWRATSDRLFGHQAEKCLAVIEQEMGY
jgi:hypothetical protein